MSCYSKSSIVAVPVAAYVTDYFTDIQTGELDLAQCKQPSLGYFGIVSVSTISTHSKFDEQRECRYEFSRLVTDVVIALVSFVCTDGQLRQRVQLVNRADSQVA